MYEVFEQLIKERGITAYKVSKDTGITQASLSKWKLGKSDLSRSGYELLAKYFGVSVDYLLTGKDNRLKDGYYINDETARMAQRILEDRDMRTLFEAAKDSSPEDLQLTAALLKRLKSNA